MSSISEVSLASSAAEEICDPCRPRAIVRTCVQDKVHADSMMRYDWFKHDNSKALIPYRIYGCVTVSNSELLLDCSVIVGVV